MSVRYDPSKSQSGETLHTFTHQTPVHRRLVCERVEWYDVSMQFDRLPTALFLCISILFMWSMFEAPVTFAMEYEPEVEGVDTRGIVPCGDNPTWEDVGSSYRYRGECSVCHFQILIKRGLDFLIAFAVAFAALLFANAGMLYVTASANASNVSKAHSLFRSTLFGLILILAAYLLTDVFMKSLAGGEFGAWNELLCKNFTETRDVKKMSTITLKAKELVLPELEKAKCQVSPANGGLGGVCSPNKTCLGIGKPVNGTDCADMGETCCINNENDKYGTACTLIGDGTNFNNAPGTCTTSGACGENYYETNAEQCGSSQSLVCCHGRIQGEPPPAGGYCSPDYLRDNGWPEASLSMAGCICDIESGGGKNACVKSTCDTCQDGTVVSMGIWQINLDAHPLGGNNCPSSISPDYGTCPQSNACCEGAKKQCTVVKPNVYSACTALACDPAFNSNWASSEFARRGWKPWTTSYNKCKKMGYK